MKAIAFLGPSGTYTELALRSCLNPENATSVFTIAEAFERVACGEVEASFVPIENVIEGPVTETLDLLHKYRGRVFIEQAYLHEIHHAIGVLPRGNASEKTTLAQETVTHVYSHKQALNQCSSYLRENFAKAKLCPVGSSAEAIALVKERKLSNLAVLAAPETLCSNDFDIVAQDVANVAHNQTRFVLLSPGNVSDLEQFVSSKKPVEGREFSKGHVTSIVINPARDRQGLLVEILDVISVRSNVNLMSIHSRPDAKGGFLFYLDLEGSVHDKQINACLVSLCNYCKNTTMGTAQLSVFGSYKSEPFYKPPFCTIGIIGGGGKMGNWFQRFFAQSGFELIVYDLDTSTSIQEVMKRADVVVLSVPMSEFPSVLDTIAPLIRSGQLLVENSSVKSCALPVMEERVPLSVETLSIHTLFGPHIVDLRGENVIVTKTSQSGQKAAYFEDLLYKYGAKITYATNVEHDKVVAVTTSLLHLVAVSFAEAVRESIQAGSELDTFSTPNFRAIMDVVARVVNQTPELLSNIQTLNEEAAVTRKRFLEAFFNFAFEIENGDVSEFIESAKLSKKVFIQ